MEFLVPWHAESKDLFVEELKREMAPGHVLSGVPVSALACRQDCDDVLFGLDDGSNRVAVVHLTWVKESNPAWPATELFSSLEEWSEAMRSDHLDFTS